MLGLFAIAFGLGLIFNAVPGPVFAETIRQSVRGGFRSALAVQLGSLIGDTLWAALGLGGIALLLQLDWLRVPVGIADIVYLFWLARDAWRASGREIEVENKRCGRKELRTGILLSLTNPQNVAYWAAIGTTLGTLGMKEPTVFEYSSYFAGFMLSSIMWAVLFAALVNRVFRRTGVRWARITYRVCAVVFLGLGTGFDKRTVGLEAAISENSSAQGDSGAALAQMDENQMISAR